TVVLCQLFHLQWCIFQGQSLLDLYPRALHSALVVCAAFTNGSHICTRTLVKCYRNHCQCSIYQWQPHLHSDTGEVRSKIVASAAFTNVSYICTRILVRCVPKPLQWHHLPIVATCAIGQL